MNWDFLAGALIMVGGAWGLAGFALFLARREALRRRSAKHAGPRNGQIVGADD